MPEKVGLTEVFIDAPKFTTKKLWKIADETRSYFPKGLLEIELLDSLSIENCNMTQEQIGSILEKIRIKNDFDKIIGLSSQINYLNKPKDAAYCGHGFEDKMVAVLNENVNLNRITLGLAHELGHLYLLSHCNYLFSKLKAILDKDEEPIRCLLMGFIEIYGLADTCKEVRKKENKDINLNIDCDGPYIMCAPFKTTKKSFSPRDYAYLESLVK